MRIFKIKEVVTQTMSSGKELVIQRSLKYKMGSKNTPTSYVKSIARPCNRVRVGENE